jgi:hypothetical protein
MSNKVLIIIMKDWLVINTIQDTIQKYRGRNGIAADNPQIGASF